MMASNVIEFRESETLRTLRTRTCFMQPFLVRSGDDSMMLAGIREGDAVRVVRRDNFTNGDIVFIETPDGLLLRFLFRVGNGQISLVGAHPECPPQSYELRQTRILGIVESEEGEG